MICEKFKKIVADMPQAPGVYIFKDRAGTIIYIGKAKSLRRRVSFYFNRQLELKTQAMVSKISDIEYRLVSSESQASILEASLIKDKQPQYNIDLKDDKSFPLVRITNEDFSVVSICRRRKPTVNGTALYFGPYTNVLALRQTMKIMRRIFGFRSCRIMPKDPCLYHRLKLCPAPCAGKISPQNYGGIIKNIILFLVSQYEELIRELSNKMQKATAQKKFEEAAKIRDQINALSAIRESRVYPAAGIEELEELRNLLNLGKPPVRIEAFDISNIFGKEACGSMVSFHNAIADKNNYRRFRIKTVESIDDYKMLAEVLRRRYSRLIRERLPLPDLVLVDGGRSHLLAADKEIKSLGIDMPLVSIAKDKENIYTRGGGSPLRLKEGAALNLIRKIRDEAHRFAIAYHHILRRKKIIGK